MDDSALLEMVKLAIPVKSNMYNSDLYDLILSAKADLRTVGLPTDAGDPFVRRAIITYCKMHFGNPPDYDRLKAAYDEQKGQLMSAHSYREEMNAHA